MDYKIVYVRDTSCWGFQSYYDVKDTMVVLNATEDKNLQRDNSRERNRSMTGFFFTFFYTVARIFFLITLLIAFNHTNDITPI